MKQTNKSRISQNLVRNMILFGILFVIAILSYFLIMDFTGNTIKQENTYKIGVVVPLKGDAGIYGEDTKKAIDLLKEDLSRENKDLLIFYEDACLAEDALKSIQKLILIDDVDLITSVFCITSINPIATHTKPEKITTMVSAAVPDSVIELDSYVFSPNSAIKDEAYAQAEFAYNELNAKTASIIWMNTDFGITYSKHFSKRFADLGGEILTNEPIVMFGTDYRSELIKVKFANPEILLSIHFGNQMALILKQAEEVNIRSQIIGTYESEDEQIIKVAGSGAEGLIISSPVGGIKGDNYYSFQEKYHNKYGEKPTVIALMAYDGLKLQIEAFDNCDGNRDCMIKYLYNVKDYEGVSGKFSISDKGTAKRTFIFKKVVNNEFRNINYNPESDLNKNSKSEHNKIKIGIVTPLTGDVGFWGESSVLGARLAEKDLKEQGIDVNFIFEDSQLDSAKALSAAQKLVNMNNVQGIYSEFNPAAISVSSFLKEKNILHVYDAAITSPLKESNNNYKSYVDYEENCKVLALDLKEQGVEKVGMLKMNLEFAELCKNGVKAVYGKNFYVESYNPGETDFRTSILKLKSNKVEAVFNTGFPNEVSNSLKQINEFGLDVIFITNTDALTTDFIENNNRILDKTITFGFPQVSEEFKQRIKNELGKTSAAPEASALAYIHLMQMAKSIDKCDDDIVCIRNEMDNMPSESIIGFKGFNNHIAELDVEIKEY